MKAPLHPTPVPLEPRAEPGSLKAAQAKPTIPAGMHDLSVHGVPLTLSVGQFSSGRSKHRLKHTLNGNAILPTHAFYLRHFVTAERSKPGKFVPLSEIPRIDHVIDIISALNRVHLAQYGLRIEKSPEASAYRIARTPPKP